MYDPVTDFMNSNTKKGMQTVNQPTQQPTTAVVQSSDTTIPVLVSGFAVGVFAILSFLKFFGKDK